MFVRRLSVFCLLLLTLFFSWNIICTWKLAQLEKEAQKACFYEGGTGNYGEKRAYLLNKYGRGKHPVWSLPFWGPLYLEDIEKHAIPKGGDIYGQRSSVVVLDQKWFIKQQIQNKNRNFDILREADEDQKKAPNKSYIDCFCDCAAKKFPNSIYRCFRSDAGIDGTMHDSEVRAVLEKKAEDLLVELKQEIQTCLDQHSLGKYTITKRGGSLVLESTNPGKDPDLEHLITKPGMLNFHEMVFADELENTVEMINREINSLKHDKQKTATGEDAPAEQREYVKLDNIKHFSCRAEYIEEVRNVIKEKQENYRLILEEAKDGHFRCYLGKYNPEENNNSFKVKKAELERGRGIHVTLDDSSAKKMESLTKRIKGSFMVVAMDDQYLTSAEVQQTLNHHFTIGPQGSERTDADWEQIATSLNSKHISAKLILKEENIISPSLGQDAQQHGFRTFLCIFLLIITLLPFIYGIAGLLADVAFIFNTGFIAGALARCGVPMSLPGIAGIGFSTIISIYISVIMLEEIRKQLRKKVKMREAISKGCSSAYRPIFDSNITTLLTAFILYFFGGGFTKGFALILMIGVICSFVTSVILFRLLLDGFISIFGVYNISFSFPLTRFITKNLLSRPKFNFLKYRKVTYVVSLLFICLGALFAHYQGLDYGIEFTQGKEYEVRFNENETVDAEKIKEALITTFEEKQEESQLNDLKLGNTVVQKIGKGQRFRIRTNFAEGFPTINVRELVEQGIAKEIHLSFLSPENQDTQDLDEGEFTIDSSASVDASVASSVQKQSMWAVALALLSMLVYIFVRFSFSGALALAAFIALVHDTLSLVICLAIAKFFGSIYVVNQVLLAAALAVVSYSVNDTVVIYHSIKRKKANSGTKNIEDIANEAINSTLNRTLKTSFITLVSVLFLYFSGILALEPIGFLLLCGTIFGTYSSVFIATPLACDISHLWHSVRKKKKKRRRVASVEIEEKTA